MSTSRRSKPGTWVQRAAPHPRTIRGRPAAKRSFSQRSSRRGAGPTDRRIRPEAERRVREATATRHCASWPRAASRLRDERHAALAIELTLKSNRDQGGFSSAGGGAERSVPFRSSAHAHAHFKVRRPRAAGAGGTKPPSTPNASPRLRIREAGALSPRRKRPRSALPSAPRAARPGLADRRPTR